MSAAARNALIKELCKALKTPTIYREHESQAREANDERIPYEDYLLQLLEAEVNARRRSSAARRLREARFPDVKTLDQIDWKALQGVSRPKILELASCEYLDRAEDVIVAGPIGTGKTHLAIALGVEATRRRKRVHFSRVADLVRDLLEARDERRLGKLQERIQRVPLLILDEFGFVPFDRAGGEVLFNLLAERHERRSTIVTTNLAFKEWVDVLGDEKLTTALLDRLASQAHVLTTKGKSYRSRRRRRRSAKG
jgi:DNA replication protein DnaC